MQNALAEKWVNLPSNEPEHGSPRLWAVQDHQEDFSCGTVKALMATERFTLHPNATVIEAAAAMERLDLDHVPVIQTDGKLVGLLTYTCLVRLIRFGMDALRTESLVRDVMVENPVCIAPDLLIVDALSTLRAHRFRFLPIVDETGILLGSVSSRDILRVMTHALDEALG